jgi:TonB family protein
VAEKNDHTEPLRNLTPELMEAYRNGTLDNKQQHRVERYLLNHPFEAEAMEGFEAMPDVMLSTDLDSLESRLDKRLSEEDEAKVVPFWTKVRNRSVRWAAVLLLLIVSSWLLYVLMDKSSELLPVELSKQDQIEFKESKKPELPTASDSQEPTIAQNLDSVPIPKKRAQTESYARPDKGRAVAEKERANELIIQEAPALANKMDEVVPVMADTLEDTVFDDAVADVEVEKEINVEEALSGRASGVNIKIRGVASFNKKTQPQPNRGRAVTGKVIDAESGEALPGVNVMVKGQGYGVNSDIEGNFQINATEDDVLVVSFIGMESTEIPVNGKNELEVELQTDVAQLSEVVVTGYGTEDKKSTDNTYHSPAPEEGFSAFREYLEENLQYPEEAKAEGIEGKVVLKLTISSSGAIKDIEVKRSLGYGCDEEAIRLVREGPNWNNARRGDDPIESTVRVKVKFKLD